MLKVIDTSIQDWAITFMEASNSEDKLLLRASLSAVDLAKYISALANSMGGHILLGAYSAENIGAGFENVEEQLVKQSQRLLDGVELNINLHQARLQNIYLLEIEKSESLAFANGNPYILKDGNPSLIS